MSKKKSTTTAVSEAVLGSLSPAKTFSYHRGASITSLDFDDSGQYLISAGIDKTIQLYDVHKGVHHKNIQSQKYGAHCARFTHHDLNCLYASTPETASEDHAIRYLSLSDKKYIKYFKGHKNQVTSLEVNPVYDTFVSASYDRTVKLWDLRTAGPTGSLEIGQPSLVAYDPHGIVFVVAKGPPPGSDTGVLQFYDSANYHHGPFLTSSLQTKPDARWTKVEFANTGKLLLVSTDSRDHYIIDTFSGQLLTALQTGSFSSSIDLSMTSNYPFMGSACFGPSGSHVIVGSAKSTLSVFDLSHVKSTDGSRTVKDTDNPRKLLPFKVIGSNQGVPKIVAFNPKLLTLATADNCVTLWQPSVL